MKKGFYIKMAWTGIRKNKRLYVPYLLTCIGMVMMFYIISFLNTSSVLGEMAGGNTMQTMLGLGRSVIGVFALIFLFYTNSFLIRRRKREFGLYNILGMGKWNLARILFWETLMTALISLGGGLAAGITFSKFAELGMINILHADVTFTFSLDPGSLKQTAVLFAVIFGLILIHTFRQIQVSNPIELLHSAHAGEKPPKANWILALTGMVILGFAYYIAVTIEDPLAAMLWFFAAVIMVIVATYLLFIAGSVVICKILQKKKNYYYRTNHFVSVSSMIYRMKRNGAGLASICILCTMVLVMMSITTCLYIGMEDVLKQRYPRNINLEVRAGDPVTFNLNRDGIDEIIQLTDQAAGENGYTKEKIQDYRSAVFLAEVEDGRITPASSLGNYSAYTQILIVPLEDYNSLTGQQEVLEQDEILICTKRTKYREETVAVGDGRPLRIKKVLSDFVDNSMETAQIIPTIYLIVPDVTDCISPLTGLADSSGDSFVHFYRIYGFDLNCTEEEQISFKNQLQAMLNETAIEGISVSCEGRAAARSSFYGLYGGLFFLGILLGVVFIFAAVLIMYYKQVSEGYEDQSRFEIMQKVGMTKKEIRRSINSQVLTVFFLPLLIAGIHLCFAFPMIHKMLIVFGLTNLKLLMGVTAGCFAVFGVFYVLVYRMTSKAYYMIVSGAKEKEV